VITDFNKKYYLKIIIGKFKLILRKIEKKSKPIFIINLYKNT